MGQVIQQLYLRSFRDGNGDGIGDLAGLQSRLEHAQNLGIDAVWLSPVHPSPNADWGYDVADYYAVHPDFGTLDELDALIADARARGIDIWLDLVPNHTSNAHAWFTEHPEYYVWSDDIPNDWTSIFTGGTAWAYDETRKQYYLHQFAPEQPDLDWWNPDVRDEFDRILRFWFDRGVRGLRIDVAHALIKDRELRDGVRYMRERPEVHEIYARWQAIAAEYDPKPTLMGETYVPLERMFAYWQHLDLAQNFDFVKAAFTIGELRPIVEETLANLPDDREACWFASNHDHSRMATRWAQGNVAMHKAALFLLLTLPGVAILYQGDEIGLEDGKVPADRILDLADPPRDPERTPLPWTRSGDEWRDPWLPLSDTSRNIEDSPLVEYTRSLIEARKELDPRAYRPLQSAKTVWAYERGDKTCLLNMSEDVAAHAGIVLQPWEGTIVPNSRIS